MATSRATPYHGWGLTERAAVSRREVSNGAGDRGDRHREALAKHEGPLTLTSMTTLTAEAGEALAKHGGTLRLGFMAELSVDVAEKLATHEGPLDLNGLTTLSDEAAAGESRDPAPGETPLISRRWLARRPPRCRAGGSWRSPPAWLAWSRYRSPLGSQNFEPAHGAEHDVGVTGYRFHFNDDM